VELGIHAEVPLADHAGCVARTFQQLRQRDFGEGQAEVLGEVARGGSAVVLVSEALLIASVMSAAREGLHTGRRRSRK
jgi:hypothetical protein